MLPQYERFLEEGTMATTIYDVAKLAGVGLGTVSRVLNNSPAVKDSTRERVQSAIRELDYTPDPIARSMTRGRTGTLAVIIPFFTRPFSIEVLRGIEASTSRLAELARKLGVESHMVDDPDELQPEWVEGKQRVGLTASCRHLPARRRRWRHPEHRRPRPEPR